ncbi:cytochrome P450 [Gongronella butleri]|nr:cytochrome P450 [Gongronella butleri]
MALVVYQAVYYFRLKYQKLNLPPRVPYSLPLVGHSLYLAWDANRFIDWCTKKYGEVFDIDLFGGPVTIASGRAGEEVLKADPEYLSLEEGILKDVLHLHYAIGKTTFEIGFHANPVVARQAIPKNKMGNFTKDILIGLDQGLNNLLSDDKEVIINNPSQFLQRFVAHMSVPTLVGGEVGTNKYVIESFAAFTGDITGNIATLMLIPKFLHGWVLPYLQSFHRHRVIMAEHMVPVVRARRAQVEAGKEFDPSQQTFLQGLIEYEKPDGTKYTDEELAEAVLLIAFASVHTTSMNLSFCLYWLIARPDLKDKMVAEIQQVLGDEPITSDKLDEMTFLDNFVREVLRQGVDKLANGKKVLKTFTFNNGFQVPKGRLIESTNRQMNLGLNVNRAAIDKMDPSASVNRAATTPSRDFVSFGLGKHLCPGRFFAVHEIKLSLITILQRYDIDTASGKKPHPIKYFAGVIALNCEEPLKFTKKL